MTKCTLGVERKSLKGWHRQDDEVTHKQPTKRQNTKQATKQKTTTEVIKTTAEQETWLG